MCSQDRLDGDGFGAEKLGDEKRGWLSHEFARAWTLYPADPSFFVSRCWDWSSTPEPIMTAEIATLICFTVAAVILFSLERFPADVIAVGLLISLVLTGLIPVDKAFAGFGSDTVVLIAGLLVLTAALERTGVMEIVARNILQRTGTDLSRIVLVVMVATTSLSAFMSNTGATAFFLPVVLGLAKRARVSPSRLLMPLAFSSIVASSVTMISTSTNLVVNGLMNQYGMASMGVFELAPVGIPIAITGVAYMFFLGRHLIPNRDASGELDQNLGHRPYATEIVVLPTSPLVGKTLEEAALGRDLDLTVTRVVRDKDSYLPPHGTTALEAGDVLLVEGMKENVLKIRDTAGIQIKSDAKLSDPTLPEKDTALVEVILLPGHWLVGRSLKNVGFRQYHGLQVLGIHRKGRNISAKISRVSLRVGDVLLVQGDRERILAMERNHAFRVLGTVTEKQMNTRRAAVAVAIFVAVLAAGSLKLVPFAVAVLIGVVLVVMTRCITPEEAYCDLEWKAVVLIGSMLGLGVAMEQTGTAKYLAGFVVQAVGDLGPTGILAAFFICTVLLTQPMSNQAAAVVIFPIAYQTALQLGLNPRAFAMIIAVAASCSYLTPLEPSCLMVYGPGRYRFMDFVKVGAPLTFATMLLALWLVPRFWPLHLPPGAR
jgi:di/tricarboxylate transporter